MPPLVNILAALGSGAARGYRASQSLERQAREGRRRALLEAAEQKAKLELLSAQTQGEVVDTDYKREQTAGLRGERNFDEMLLNRPLNLSSFDGPDVPITNNRALFKSLPFMQNYGDNQRAIEAARIGAGASRDVANIHAGASRYAADQTYSRYENGLVGNSSGRDPMEGIFKILLTSPDLAQLTPEQFQNQAAARLLFIQNNKKALMDMFNVAAEDDSTGADSTATPRFQFDPKLVPPKPKRKK